MPFKGTSRLLAQTWDLVTQPTSMDEIRSLICAGCLMAYARCRTFVSVVIYAVTGRSIGHPSKVVVEVRQAPLPTRGRQLHAVIHGSPPLSIADRCQVDPSIEGVQGARKSPLCVHLHAGFDTISPNKIIVLLVLCAARNVVSYASHLSHSSECAMEFRIIFGCRSFFVKDIGMLTGLLLQIQ